MKTELENFIEKVKITIKNNDFIQDDPRLKRKTYSLIGHRIYFEPGRVLSYLKETKPIIKYRQDWERMNDTFRLACRELTNNPDSRRAVVLNTQDYDEIYPCFLSIQIAKDKDGKFNVMVYQRSGDIEKMKDDLVFFGYVMKKFEEMLNIETKHLAVVYGSLHYDVNLK